MPIETGTTPIRWDLTGEDAITQGANWSRYIALVINDAGDVWNTTGFTGRLTIRNSYDTAVIFSGSTADGRIVTGLQTIDGQTYCLQITLTGTSTTRTQDPTLNTLGYGVWDMEVTDPYGHITRVFHGRATLSKEVGYQP